jgi:hypothetical protein
MAEVMVDEYGRPEPPREGGEVATLLGFLDYQRATLEWKCRGLSDEQLRVAPRPSSMTLGGLLKHLALGGYVRVQRRAPHPGSSDDEGDQHPG